jgi:hypothetical protein
MMHNSLDRLLSGIALSLTEVIAPALSDPYARAQALAAAEIVANLAPRITWDPAQVVGPVRTMDDSTPLDTGPASLELLAAGQVADLAGRASRAQDDTTGMEERLAIEDAIDADLDHDYRLLRHAPKPGARRGQQG